MVIYMSYIASVIEREAERMSALLVLYEDQLAALPKGSLRSKERNGRRYFYLSYRKNGKVVTDYVGTDEALLDTLREQLKRRQDIEQLSKALKHELRRMNKAREAAK